MNCEILSNLLGLPELLRTKEIENIKLIREIDIEKIENILDYH